MNYKNPRYKFLNENPNPTLGDLLAQFEAAEENNEKDTQNISVLANDLKQELEKLSIPDGVIILVEQLQQQIEQKYFFKASDKIKNGLKRIKLLKQYDEIQQKIEILHGQIEKANNQKHKVSIHEKSLELLCDLAYLNKSTYTPLETIKKELSSEAFTLYVAFQTIACVNGDGWAFGIFGNMPELVSYIPESLETLGYKKVPEAIRNTVKVFPENTNFLFDNEEYIDILNFIENPRRKIENPKLEKYTKEEREEFCTNYHISLEKIEEAESEIWNENDELRAVFDYYIENLENKIWKTTNNNTV